MKKILIVLFTVCFLTITLVACAGQDVTPGATPVAAAHNTTDHVGIVPPIGELDPDEDGTEIDLAVDRDRLLPGNGGIDHGDKGFPAFISVTGVITNIEVIESLTHVDIEDTNGNPATLLLNEETVFPFSTDFAVGDNATGWFSADIPMRMIWPAQYPTTVFIVHTDDERNVTVDRFFTWDVDFTEGYLLSRDKMFAFKVDDNTEIILEDGQDFSDGILTNRNIVVIYGLSTHSIPEQALAMKLIVLFEDIAPFG